MNPRILSFILVEAYLEGYHFAAKKAYALLDRGDPLPSGAEVAEIAEAHAASLIKRLEGIDL